MTADRAVRSAERHDVFPLFCGFCMADEDEADVLVRGPIVCICDKCILVMVETVASRRALSDAEGEGGGDHG